MSRTTKKTISRSQELRNIFYALFNQDPEEFGEDFDAYYDSKMEKLCMHYKKMINR